MLLAFALLALIALMLSAVSYALALKLRSEDALAPLLNTVVAAAAAARRHPAAADLRAGLAASAIADWNPFSWAADGVRALFAGDPGADSVWQALVDHRRPDRASPWSGRPARSPERP